MLPGAQPAPYPRFVPPCVPTLKSAVPIGGRWLYEIKLTATACRRCSEGKPSLLTSSGLDWTRRFKSVVASLRDLSANSIVIDGEAVVPDGDYARHLPSDYHAALRDPDK